MHACDTGVNNGAATQSGNTWLICTAGLSSLMTSHDLQTHNSPKPSPSGDQQWTLQGLCDAISVATRGERIDVHGRASLPPAAAPKKTRHDPNGARSNALSIAGRAVCATPVRLERCPRSDGDALPTEGPLWTLRAPDTPVWAWTVAECHSVDICTATIELPKDGYLILKSACRGLTFRDVHFRGTPESPPTPPNDGPPATSPMPAMPSGATIGSGTRPPCAVRTRDMRTPPCVLVSLLW